MKVYLSGPMTGITDWNFPAFNEAAERLRGQGHEVVNPAERDNGDTSQPRDYYMREDIKDLLNCEGIFLLAGWLDSPGAVLEYKVALACKLQIIYPEDTDPRPKRSVLVEADQLTRGARQESYGHPSDNHSRTARFWSTYLDVKISPQQVCFLNVLQKIGRSMHAPDRDHLVDIVGYIRNVEMIEDH